MKAKEKIKALFQDERKAKILWNTARLAVYLLAFFLTPLLAIPLGILFDPVTLSDWWHRGDLRGFYTGLITGFLWLGEFIALYCIDKKLQKKFNLQIDPVKPTAKQNKPTTEQPASTEKTAQSQEAAASSTQTTDKPTAKTTPAEKPKTELLGWDRMVAIFLISAACILIISAQIGFQVKVFYELGERATLIEIINFSGQAGKNIAKCGWIVLLLKAAFGLFENLFDKPTIVKKTQNIWTYLCVTAVMLLFATYDVLVPINPFGWTYILFYVAFVALYALTNRAPIKSYLLILFIYFF